MNPKYVIDGTGAPNTRLNVDDFSTNDQYKIQWSLFLRALAELQLAPPTDPTGYYRIAGIHGWPLVTWPELEAQPGKTIYCAHGTTRFLTWHRPYLLLLEQRLVEIAVTLAALAPAALKAQYMEEALKVRVPFWDWAEIPALPAAAVKPEAYIIIPELDPVNPTAISNPLYSYTLTGPYKTGYGPVTTRFPDAQVKQNLTNYGLRANIYHCITSPQAYAPFSNAMYSPTIDPVEQPHNNVHNAIGGEMPDPFVTAFDPIFWLFHATMDRYYALWQTIRPDTLYGENHQRAHTVDDWLTPFNRSIGAWTSRMVQRSDSPHVPNTWTFGYQYPETLVQWTDAERKAAAWAAIRKYTPLSPGSERYPPGAIHRGDRANLPGYPADLPDEASIRREWRVLIKVNNNIVVGNFIIFVFIGDAGDVPGEWDAKPSIVGSFSTFKAPLQSCDNCRQSEGKPIHGSVYLTDKLYKLLPHGGRLENQESVTPFLIKKLDWRIRKADGTEFVLPAGEKGLCVGVESFMEAYAPVDKDGTPLDCDPGSIIGVTFDHVKHPEITRGKSNKGGETD